MKTKIDEEDAGFFGCPGFVDDEEVSRVWIGMEEPVDKDLFRVGTCQDFEDRSGRDAQACKS